MRTARRGLELVAKAVALVTGIVAAVIVLGILFVVLEANPQNTIVDFITDVGKKLVGPFDGLFNLKGRKLDIAVNWGIAAAVWFIAGRILASLLRR